MKPRIHLSHKVWCCHLPDWPRTRVVGMGYTPKEAYDDWEKQLQAFQRWVEE